MQFIPTSLLRITASVAAALLISGCVPNPEIPAPNPGRADFSRTVVIGGSELSGYMDGALTREGQAAAIGNLVALQLQAAGPGAFSQHLLPVGAEIGLNKPWVSTYRTHSQLGDRTDCEGVVSLGPVSDTVSESAVAASGAFDPPAGTFYDFSVPHAGLADWTRVGLGQVPYVNDADVFASRLNLDPSKSLLNTAVARNPTFFVAWPGMQDVLNWATQGGHNRTLPTPADFRLALDSILQALTDAGAQGVLATLPDIGHLPYFTTIPARALTLNQAKADSLNNIYTLVGANVNFIAGDNGFIVGDPGSSVGYRQLEADEYITLNVPLDSMKCYFMGVLFTLMPNRYTLIRSELSQLRNYVSQYNDIIVELAAEHDLAVADMRGFYSRLDAGVRFDGVDFNTEFVSGGYFSLDGLFPHPKGAALAANEFIAAINAHYGATVPPVQAHRYRGILFP